MSISKSRDSIVKSSYAELYGHILDGIENKKSIMIWGDPGIGKTSIIRYIAKLLDYHLELIILSSKSQYDVAGMPINVGKDDIADNVVEYSMASFLYNSKKIFKEHKKNTIFLFDEINTADRFTLAPAYQFLQERGIGDDKFHENDIIIASGNYDDTGGLTEKMPLPLAGRVKHIYLEVSADDWINIYASRNNIHPLIISFFQKPDNNCHFMNFDYEALNASACKSFASPRTLDALSDDLYTLFRNKKSLTCGDEHIDGVRKSIREYLMDSFIGQVNDQEYASKIYNNDYMLAMIQSHIGIDAGNAFYEWAVLGSKLPPVEDFFNGVLDEDKLVKDIGDGLNDLFYIFSNSACTYLKRESEKGSDVSEKLNKYIAFIKDNFSELNFTYAAVILVMVVYKIKFNHSKVNEIDSMFRAYKKVA